MGFQDCYIWRQHVLDLPYLKNGCKYCHDFLGVDIRFFFLLESLFFVQFGLAFWLAISSEYVSLQLEVNLGNDTHT